MERPKQGLVRRRTKLASSYDKKIANDEFMAAAIGDVEWLRQSLRSRGGVISYDQNGLAPIHLASIHGRLECLKLLIDKLKIDVNLPSTTSWRPVHLVISNQTGKRSFQCLLYLLEKGADPSVTNDDSVTPMHQAASEGHVQCLKALIEVGAKIDGEDRRGNKPADLAKLWGHRKCARILGAEMWHREKDFLSKELYQLQKVKMQQVLQEMEQDETKRYDQQFYGELAYRNWLADKGFNTDKKGGEKSAEAEESKHGKPKDSVQKPNSIPLPSNAKMRGSAGRGSITESTESNEPNIQKQGKQQDAPESNKKGKEITLERGSARHEYPWNISTHLPEYDYPSKLPDYYPRDEYTMKPKYPLKKGGVPVANTNMIPIAHEDISSATKLRKPELPPKMLEKALLGDAASQDRPVVYKCKNIIDVQTLRRYDSGKLPKAESGLHLCDDVNSALFKFGLQSPETNISASNTSLKSVSSAASSSKLSANASKLSLAISDTKI